MHDIEMHEVSEEFSACWAAAGQHLENRAQGSLSWLKACLTPPFLEHMSFRMGNQLFFIRIEDIEGRLQVPGNFTGFQTIADGCNGHACLLSMRRTRNDWIPETSGWGLFDPKSGRAIDPVSLVSDEKFEMTNWELQDFAVQVVREHITEKLGHQLMSSQGNPQVNPSIWFVGDQGPEWVLVRAARYPIGEINIPSNIREIANSCAHLSHIGHFASVSFANTDDAFDPTGAIPALPLWRGHGMHIRFEGLIMAIKQ